MKYLILTNHSYMLWQFRRELIARLLQQGNVVISTPFVGRQEDFQAMGCRCIETALNRRQVDPPGDIYLHRFYLRLLKTERPELVLTYSIKPNIFGGLACRRLGIPYCSNVQGLGSAFTREPMASAVSVLYRAALKGAGTVFFENTASADEFARRRIVPRSRRTLLPGAGVNLAWYPQMPYPDRADGIHFLYLGRFMREKGVEELFAAARKLHGVYGQQVVLDLAGFFEEDCRSAVDQLVRDGVARFHGFQADPRPLYQAAHCVVVPSYHEGMSNVLLEAASCGRAVIASDIPGCREAVEDGKTGLLVPVRDADALYRAMETFIKLPEARWQEMGALGRGRMALRFDRVQVVARTLAAISSTDGVETMRQ